VAEMNRDRPPVRRGVLRWPSVALIVLAPFAIHAIWGYIEARRLRAAIVAIEARGEPTRRSTALPSADAARSDRYYRAAAALSSRIYSDLPTGLMAAERSGEWPVDLTEKLRDFLGNYRVALQLLDWAAPLPYENSDPAEYVGGDLMSAIRLGYLHALERALHDDGEGAAAALYSTIRAGRYFDGDLSQYLYSSWAAAAVGPVLERTRPTQPSLTLVAQALADNERDDILRAQFLFLRVELLQRRPADPWVIGPRARPTLVINDPLGTHRVVEQLETLKRLLEAASAPWPDRIDAVVAIDARALSDFVFGPVEIDRDRLEAIFVRSVPALAVNRAMRIAVAVEQYRRDHGEQMPPDVDALVPAYLDSVPLDPFTGKALRFVKEADAYVAYSLGSNRQDDGGDVTVGWRDQDRSAPDPGIRIRYAK
jgi:hypothetical protein